jgi:predicted dehydrogenase
MAQQLKLALVGFGMTAQVMHAPFLKTLPQYQVSSGGRTPLGKIKSVF